ncbi:heme-binding protein [Natrinema sp. H-ect4]|uniref:SOUL family heme-binding protein n=1 Tax=Natrinema sp. H-ect4 TaxID=3242699 RepID=UPI0035A886DE
MRSARKILLSIGGLLVLWIGWGVYVTRTTDRVPSETLDRFDGVEIRRYPRMVLVETMAQNARTAFGRLFRYISGANARDEDVGMTAPVAVRGTSIPMTAPVRTGPDGGDVTMAFFLPQTYTPETAPTPTDADVRLAVESPRTVAVRRFSWYATDERVARNRERLLEQLSRLDLEARGEPTLLQYNDPWTPPFMRTNEVEVELEAVPERLRREAP